MRGNRSGQLDPVSSELAGGVPRLLLQKLHVHAAAEQVLSQQVARLTEEVEELQRRPTAERAETRWLRQELAVATEKARALERPPDPGS